MAGQRNHSEDVSGTQGTKFRKAGLNWLWGPQRFREEDTKYIHYI